MAPESLKHLATDYLRNRRPTSPGRSLVLLYHSVDESAPYRSVSPAAFASHLDWLIDHTDLLTLDALLAGTTRRRGGRPQVAITFDDGFSDNHAEALPLLAERGLSASFFISTGLIDRLPFVMERFARLHSCASHDIGVMNWSQVRELQSAGMEIGAHTVSHPNLAAVGADALRRELVGCKADLEDRLGVPVNRFAYPFGKPKHNYGSREAQAVAAAGFAEAVAVTYRPIAADYERYRIPRYSVVDDDLSTLESIVGGGFDPLGWWQLRAPAWLSGRLSPDSVFDREFSMFEQVTQGTDAKGGHL